MQSDPYKYFRVEAREIVEQIGKGVMALEKGAPRAETVASLLRLAHTLKGAARVVKQSEIADDMHALEDLLDPYRDGLRVLPRDRIDAVLKIADAISNRVSALSSPDAPDPATPAPPDTAFRSVRADVVEINELLDGISEANAHLGSLRRGAETLAHARRLADLLAEQSASSTGAGAAGQEVSSTIVGDLQKALATLERGFATGVEQIDREIRQVRDTAERLRLVPAGEVFLPLERVARDTAQAQGKRVVFEGTGGDARLDAHVLDSIQKALLQVVRNAVAHGIETEFERESAGKPLVGKVAVHIERRGRRVVFTCRDDGRGFDLEAVRRIVAQRGELSAETQKLGPKQLIALLLKGGISTSRAVTEVSGRGIGLDVARDVAGSLGGEIRVETEPGRGSVIEIAVPLSLASIEGLLVNSLGVTAAIPLGDVRCGLWLSAGDIARTALGETVAFQGNVIPYIPLASILNLKREESGDEHCSSAVVVNGASGAAALGVDRLLGTANMVLRPLPELAPAASVVAGAALDAAGNPFIVLDADGLVAEARRAVRPLRELDVAQISILIVDDSLTTRMLEQSILESAGYDVDLATCGEEGLEKAKRGHHALFLVDVEMPGMDGFTFIERVRAEPELRDIPAILVTSRASPEDRRRGAEVGARAYIVKTEFDQRDLLDRIQGLIG